MTNQRRTRVLGRFLLVSIVCLLTAAPTSAVGEPSCGPGGDAQAAVEAGLLPAIVLDGESEPRWPVVERMVRYRVPGVSIVVIADGKLAWSAGYGLRKRHEGGPVSSRTLFQAASISKPVAALVALGLVREGRLPLDTSVNAQLRGWKIPASEHGDSDAITLRELLSHTSGLGLHGFPGYAEGARLPTLIQLLDGKPPANSPPVGLVQAPGTGYRYSGAGYEVMQLLLEETSGKSFAPLADEHVLQPLQMRRSAFAASLPPGLADDVALGHGFNGLEVAGGWHRYPELAAAGLWSTPTDLARFALAMMKALNGEPGTTLAPRTARLMLAPVVDGMGLGLGVHGEGDAMFFDHAGATNGYRTYLIAYPARGEGLVVMTNGDGGGDLIEEIRRSVARTYGWPDFAPKRVKPMPATAAELESRVGDYAVEEYGFAISIRRSGNALIASTPRGSRYTFRKVGPHEFTAIEDASTLRFNPGHPGTLEVWGMTAHVAPAE